MGSANIDENQETEDKRLRKLRSDARRSTYGDGLFQPMDLLLSDIFGLGATWSQFPRPYASYPI